MRFVLCRAVSAVSCLMGLACERPNEQQSGAPSATARIAPVLSPKPDTQSQGPRVALSGVGRSASEPSSTVTATRPRIYSRAFKTWVYAAPSSNSARLGYLRAGASSPRAERAASTEGCSGGWFRVEPEGYVCAGSQATLDGRDPVVLLAQGSGPDRDRKLPYIYGTVRRPGPVYDRLLGEEQLAEAEPDLARRMIAWLEASGEIGASYAQDVWLGAPGSPPEPRLVWEERRTDGVPALIATGARLPVLAGTSDDDDPVVRQMRPRAGYSFLRTFLWRGRRYGLTPSLAIAPTDRFRPIRGSDFRGVEIGLEIAFPFALVRRKDARLYSYQGSGDALVDAGEAPYGRALALTGKQAFFRGKLHYETKAGFWVSDRHASRVEPAKRMPAWGTKGERWLDVNLTKQTLVAYEGTKPVYATLISSGEAGLEDPTHTTATKRGIFRIHTKHVTSTMSSEEAGEEFELRDVPYVQYFDQGYALHGAYWHDRFGTPKSHGCINLSPEDARRIFFFTEPAVPEGWHGALLPLRGTVVFVHP